jgi:hypothetical protein
MTLPPVGTTVRIHPESVTPYRRMVGTVVEPANDEERSNLLRRPKWPVLVDFGRDALLCDLPEKEQFAADEVEILTDALGGEQA